MAGRAAAHKIYRPVSDDDPRELDPNPPTPWIGRAIWVGIGLAIGLTFLTFSRPRPGTMTTDTRSGSLQNDRARIEFLQRYLKLPSEVQATEFHITFKDNRKGMVSSPSDYDIRVAVKVPPEKVPAWAADMPKVEPFDVAWARQLLPKDDRWAVHSTPTFYARDRVFVVTYEPEGIVFKRVSSQ